MVENHAPDAHLVARLRAALRVRPQVSLAILFGSAARGTNRPDSDIDVAILALESHFSEADELALNRELSLAAHGEVHLVRLETAPTLLKWQIATRGVPLAEQTPRAFARFRARAASEYIDFASALTHHGEIFRRRLMEERGVR